MPDKTTHTVRAIPCGKCLRVLISRTRGRGLTLSLSDTFGFTLTLTLFVWRWSRVVSSSGPAHFDFLNRTEFLFALAFENVPVQLSAGHTAVVEARTFPRTPRQEGDEAPLRGSIANFP